MWRRWGGSRHTAPITLGHWPALSLAEARRTALEAMQSSTDPRSQHRQRRSPADTKAAQAALFVHAARRYIGEVISRQARAATTRREWETVLIPAFGDRYLAEITRGTIVSFLQTRYLAHGKGRMAERMLTNVRSLYRRAIAQELGGVTANPAAGAAASLKVLTVETAASMERRAARAERVLNTDEIRWFWQATEGLDPVRRGALRMLLLTGGRLCEVTEMTHAEFDLSERLWRLPARRMKTGRAHVVPLTDEMLAVLAAVPRMAGSAYVFTGAQGGPVSLGSRVKAQLDAAMQQAAGGGAIEPWTVHHLRRVMRSGMAALGVGEVVAEACLAHVQKGIVAVYNRHDFLPERRAATEKWNAHVLRVVNGDDGNVVPLARRA